ncbi:MAG: N-formylglutamate amidohydrolase [Xanthomonadales bacterium]|nr:N-formylglutamate amidohydrolase [Xanthomonadales bacterium]
MSELNNLAAYRFTAGATPLLISVPHSGLGLLKGMQENLSPDAVTLPDTDWRVDELYTGAGELGAGMLIANYSRYVVDLNRPPDNAQLYASEISGLFPHKTFHNQPLWLEQSAVDSQQKWIMQNIWQAYHQKIRLELERIKQRHGFAILLDAHSIVAEVPGLFRGVLPDLNLGSYDGRSASATLIEVAYASLESPAYSRVLDGRFKGGAITRGFGRPAENIHALQLEISQSTYLQPTDAWPQIDVSKASRLRQTIQRLLNSLLEWQGGSS